MKNRVSLLLEIEKKSMLLIFTDLMQELLVSSCEVEY